MSTIGRRGLTFNQFENALESLARRSLLQAATQISVSGREAKFRLSINPEQTQAKFR
jgi:hypothetical protein